MKKIDLPYPPGQGPDDEVRYRPISGAHIARLALWLKPYWKLYLAGALCGLLGLCFELCVPGLQQHLIDDAIPSGEAGQIVRLCALWLGLMAVSLGLDALQLGATSHCGERVVRDLRLAVFAQLQRLSMSFYDKTKLGRVITRGSSDVEALRGPVATGLNTVLLNTVLMAGSAVLMGLTDWRLFLAVAWLAPVLGICNRIYRKRIGAQWQVVRAHFSRVASNLAENITGVRVVSAFNRQDENLERFNELQEENTANNLKAANINGIYQPLLEFIRFIGQVVILGYGSIRVMEGGMTPGQVIKMFSFWAYFMRPTIAMGDFYNSLMQAMASCERIFSLFDMAPGIQDRPSAQPLPRVCGQVLFDHVTFGYDPARPVLHDMCLEIPAGQTCALVGATGSGKSSTVALLARFYEFQKGRILVDGHDIRECTRRSLHQQMGIVLQNNYLFSGTILTNIRYPRPEATDEEVYAAAKALDIYNTIAGLPDGFHTEVGERGGSVSLGLRQLICFARVFLANPRIFLLDEATSAIDTVTELKVQAALERLVQGRTTVIVAHRLSTIVKADHIVVLEQGLIIERGRHEELLAARGVYAQLYEQFIASEEVVPQERAG